MRVGTVYLSWDCFEKFNRLAYFLCFFLIYVIRSSQQQQQQPEPNFQNISTQSWYPPSVVGSSSHPSTPSSSSASPHQRASDHPQPSSRGQPSPAEAAGIIARLKDKRYTIGLLSFQYCLHLFVYKTLSVLWTINCNQHLSFAMMRHIFNVQLTSCRNACF